MEIELAVLALAGQKFAQGALGWLGSQVARRWFERDPDQQFAELYLEVCADAFAGFPDVSEEESERLAHFLARKRWVRPLAESSRTAKSTARE